MFGRRLGQRCLTSSQHQNVPPIGNDELAAIVQSFDAPIRFCAAYGSAVFRQQGRRAQDRPVVDFIFGVTHSQHWHSLNLRQHADHYSFMKYFGSKSIQLLQENFGTRLYYNTNCKIHGQTVKYGVVSMEHLLDDLADWQTMFCAGRLHKPVRIVNSDPRVTMAQQNNLKAALSAALLMLPQEFDDESLFRAVCSLSYTGDFRMKVFGEDPHKIFNIVHSQMDEFTRLYSPVIDTVPHVDFVRPGLLQQDRSVKARARMLRELPAAFRERLLQRYIIESGNAYIHDDDDNLQKLVIEKLAQHSDIERILKSALSDTILTTSITQAAKGVLTAGPLQSVAYAARKLRKGLFR